MRMLPQNACLPILHLSPLFPPASFVVDGYIGLGATVPIGTDDLIQHFDRCEAITVYVDKVDSIQDGFIHRKFCFRRAAFYQSLKSKVGLAAAKAAALRINLNVKGCGVLAPPEHAPSRAPLLLPLLLSHNLPFSRVH
jgi:hypothetical protein